MNAVHMKNVESSLTGLTRKVYFALPIAEPWSGSQICMELKRTGVSGADRRAVDSCLHLLSDRGLLKEPTRGQYQRLEIKEKPAKEIPLMSKIVQISPEAPAQKAPALKEEKGGDGLSELGAIAVQLRKLADCVETAALGMEERSSKSQQDAEKLRQLQALLKSIG